MNTEHVHEFVLLARSCSFQETAAQAFLSQSSLTKHIQSLEKKLGVMDGTAATLCRENGLPILVFDLAHPANIARAVKGEDIGTLVQEA